MAWPAFRTSAALALVFMTACGGAAGRPRADADALRIDGAAALDELSPTGLEHFEIELLLHNPGGPRRLTRAEVLLASEGGWSFSLGDPLKKRGSLFGLGPELVPGRDLRAHLSYWWSAPISLFFLRVDSVDGAGAPQASMVQIPVARAGFAAPAHVPLRIDGFLALQEPVEIVSLSNGKRWLPLTGQIVNVTGRPVTLARWRMTVRGEGGAAILDQDLGATFHVVNSDAVVIPFLYGFDVPSDVSRGSIAIDAAVAVAGASGAPRPLARVVEFTTATPMRVRPPVSGAWIWKNGPGEMVPHAHTPWPEQRYAYDLSVLRGPVGRRSTFEGDADKNESFFAWNQPILAAADGTVAEVVDDVPDNFGRTPNPANPSRRNARVVLSHGEGRYSVYAHVRQGSAAVKAGDRVKAGDLLGKVGNAGFSSEPHLHFACFEIDRTGRPRALAIEAAPLATPGGEPVRGVPVGSLVYVSE